MLEQAIVWVPRLAFVFVTAACRCACRAAMPAVSICAVWDLDSSVCMLPRMPLLFMCTRPRVAQRLLMLSYHPIAPQGVQLSGGDGSDAVQPALHCHRARLHCIVRRQPVRQCAQ